MKNRPKETIYRQMQRFADITKASIVSGNIKRAKRCLGLADRIFTQGNTEIKNAIVNVYVFSVSTFMEIHHVSIRSLFPESLQSEYKKQINTSSV